MLALVSDWIKRFGNSSSAPTKICQNRHLFPRLYTDFCSLELRHQYDVSTLGARGFSCSVSGSGVQYPRGVGLRLRLTRPTRREREKQTSGTPGKTFLQRRKIEHVNKHLVSFELVNASPTSYIPHTGKRKKMKSKSLSS